MKKYIIITGDTNDGDYVTERTLITEEKFKSIKPVIEEIKNFKPYKSGDDSYQREHRHNYPTGDCQREDLGEKSVRELYGHLLGFEYFDEICPHPEHGIHTIVTIELITVVEEIRLL